MRYSVIFECLCLAWDSRITSHAVYYFFLLGTFKTLFYYLLQNVQLSVVNHKLYSFDQRLSGLLLLWVHPACLTVSKR